jgi:hypothetical protein
VNETEINCAGREIPLKTPLAVTNFLIRDKQPAVNPVALARLKKVAMPTPERLDAIDQRRLLYVSLRSCPRSKTETLDIKATTQIDMSAEGKIPIGWDEEVRKAYISYGGYDPERCTDEGKKEAEIVSPFGL